MADVPVSAPVPAASPAPDAKSDSSMKNALSKASEAVSQEVQNLEDTGEDYDGEEVVAEELTPKEKKKWLLKVGGKDVEIDSEDELVKKAQMGVSAQEKWQEAAKLKKDVDSFIAAIEADPFAVLKKMGKDPDKLAEEYIQRRIEEMQKSPEQLEREATQKELMELKAEREKEKEDARQGEMTRLQQQYAIEIESDINNTLDTIKDLPKSPYVVKRIADLLMLGLKEGIDLKVQDVVPIAQNQIKQELKEMFAVMPEEVIEAVVGKDVLNKVRKKRMAQGGKPPVNTKVQSTGASELNKNKAEETKSKVNARDFFKTLGSY